MKLIKIIIILLSVSYNCYTQTILDPPPILDSLDSSVLNTDVNEFKRGWNWIQTNNRLDAAMEMDYAHGEYISSLTTWQPNMNYISQIPGFSAGHMHFAKMNSMAVQFDPAIRVYTTSNFKPENWDNKGAIFGFQTKSNGTIDSATGSDTFHRFLLNKAGVSQERCLYNY
jgi:hypothetical protein